MSKIFVIGGPGNISESAFHELLAAGHTLRVLTLPGTPPGAFAGMMDFVYGDRNDEATLQNAFASFAPDIVLDFTCFTPAQAKAAAAVARGRVQQYIFVSTVDIYGYPLSQLPMPEDGALRPPNCAYAANKLACEELLRGVEGLPLTIARPAYSMGRRFLISALSREGGAHTVARLRAGKPLFSPGDGTTLIHAGCAYNTGRMVAALAGNPQAVGRAVNCAHDSVLSYDEYLATLAGVVGCEPHIVHMPTDFVYTLPPEITRGVLLNDLARHNLLFSVDTFRALAPGFVWEKKVPEAMAEFVARLDAEAEPLPPDTVEDTILAAYGQKMR